MNVIFDLGKVLIDYDFGIFYRALICKNKSFSITEAEQPVLLFDSGKLSRREFYLAMKELLDFNVDQKAFEHAWKNVFFPIDNMLEMSRKIAQNHDVFILSNTDEIHFPYIWEKFPQLHHFGDNLMLSYELKSVKPDVKIFELALAKYDLNPKECIFIDDKYENVEAVRNFGMFAIWHQSFDLSKQKLSNFLTEN
jgi:HAD superfamily hydrolase (TIGR01509 family)